MGGCVGGEGRVTYHRRYLDCRKYRDKTVQPFSDITNSIQQNTMYLPCIVRSFWLEPLEILRASLDKHVLEKVSGRSNKHAPSWKYIYNKYLVYTLWCHEASANLFADGQANVQKTRHMLPWHIVKCLKLNQHDSNRYVCRPYDRTILPLNSPCILRKKWKKERK